MHTKQKFKLDEKVYTHFYDYETHEILCEEYQVWRYDYMDGMQWNVIDEYQLMAFDTVRKYIFFKTKKRRFLNRPSHLIHKDKEISRTLLIMCVLDKFNFDDEKFVSIELKRIVHHARKEYKKIESEKPELLLKVSSIPVLTEENNYTLWR
jgi:hypothetical protein